MSLPSIIDDGHGSGSKARVTSIGELVVAPFSYDLTKFVELAVVDTGYNFYEPKAGEQLVITGVIATGDKQIGANEDATIVIYEASTDVTTTEDKVLLQFVLTQSTVISFLPLKIIVNEGKYVNAKTDNDDVHMNILGYPIPTLP